jgi:hypothetical protein
MGPGDEDERIRVISQTRQDIEGEALKLGLEVPNIYAMIGPGDVVKADRELDSILRSQTNKRISLGAKGVPKSRTEGVKFRRWLKIEYAFLKRMFRDRNADQLLELLYERVCVQFPRRSILPDSLKDYLSRP